MKTKLRQSSQEPTAPRRHSLITDHRINVNVNNRKGPEVSPVYLPGVNFWLTTSGKADLGFGELTVAGGEALSLCVGLSQKGMQRLRLAGRPPNTGSQSNERLRVAHAIFSSVANTSQTKQTLFQRLPRNYYVQSRNCTWKITKWYFCIKTRP